MSFDVAMYERIRQGCIDSAAAVVPEIYRRFKPKSVLDVGGGEGWWARAFRDQGAEHVSVLDESIETPHSEDGVFFTFAHLEHAASIGLDRAYDLALCLETAEHISSEAGDYLVDLLAASAPVVVFSAAVPGQGGHGHVNEQWPSYWVERFAKHGLIVSDTLRWMFWDDERVEPWYRQNLLVFASGARLTGTGLTGAQFARSVVHPEIWSWKL